MVNTRSYILPSSLSPELRLRCRLYSTSCRQPQQVDILTRCADASHGSPRFPIAESLLQDAVLQPYIHNCRVTVYEGCHTYQYFVFFKRHRRLRVNAMLSTIESEFRGDAVVMRIGARVPAVVNMRGRDTMIADYLISRIAPYLSRRGRLPLPRLIRVVKPVNTNHGRNLRRPGMRSSSLYVLN